MDLVEGLKCNREDHDNQVEMICLNDYCKEFRLFCCKCSGLQDSHSQHYDKIDKKIIPFLDQCQIDKNTLINCIKQSILKLNSKCEILEQAINLKFNISNKTFKLMKTLQDRNDAIQVLVLLTYTSKNLLKIFKQKIDSLVEEIESCTQNLKVEEFEYTKQVDFCQKQSFLQFQKASCIYKNKQTEAKQHIKEALEYNPSNADAKNLQSQMLLNMAQIDEAKKIIKESLKIDPYKFETILLQAKILPIQQKDLNQKKIIHHYDEIAKQYSKNDKILLEKANALFSNGFYNESLNYYSELITKEVVDLDKIYAKGCELRKLGKLEEAITWYERILEYDSNHLNAISSKGQILISSNKHREALTLYEEQLQNWPYQETREELVIGKCEALFHLKKHQEAIEYFSKNKTRKFLPKIFQNCQDLIQQKSYDDAILWSKTILLIDNHEQKFFTDCALSLQKNQLFKESEPWFDQAQKISKQYFPAYYEYTWTLFQQSKFEEAFNMFCQMLEENKQNIQNYLHIAEKLFRKKEFDLSLKWYQKFRLLNFAIQVDFMPEVFKHCEQLFKQDKYFESLKWAKLIAYSNRNYIKNFQQFAKILEGRRLQQDAQKWNEAFKYLKF